MSDISTEIVRILKHTAIYSFSNIIGKAIGFLLIPLYTRYLIPEDYGTLELLDVSINIVGMFVGLGLGTAVARFYANCDKLEDKRKVVSTALLILIVLTMGFLALVWPFSHLISQIVLGDVHLVAYVQISIATFALNAIWEIPLVYIRVLERSLAYSLVSLAKLAVSLSLNIYFVVFLKMGVLGILYSALISATIFSLLLTGWCIKDVGFRLDFKIGWSMVLYGAPLILNSLGMFIIHFGDRFFLKYSATLSTIGVYSLGYKIAMGIVAFLIGQSFSMFFSVRCFTLIKEEGGEEKFAHIFVVYTYFLLVVCLFLSFFSYEMIFLIADIKYIESYKIVSIVSFAYFFREVSEFFRYPLLIKGKTEVIGFFTILSSAFCVVSYWIFIPLFHDIGAAFSTLLIFLFMAIMYGIFSYKIIPVNYKLVKISIVSIIFIFSSFCCYYFIGTDVSIFSVLTKLLSILSLIMISFFILFSKEEIPLLSTHVRNFQKKLKFNI